MLSTVSAATCNVEYTSVPDHLGGLHGGALDGKGNFVFGTLFGGDLMSIDINTNKLKVEVPMPWGAADDVAIRLSDGMMAWTSIDRGEIWARFPDGSIELAATLMGVNPIKVNQATGQFWVAPCFFATGLYKLDLAKGASKLTLVEGTLETTMINSFEIGDGQNGRPDDGMLYAPTVGGSIPNSVIKMDPVTGKQTQIYAFPDPEYGVAFDGNGVLHTVAKKGMAHGNDIVTLTDTGAADGNWTATVVATVTA